MGLAEWKKEYYPIEAKFVPLEEAIAHSLKKWKGLTDEVLKAFGVVRGRKLYDKNVNVETSLAVNSDTCALCHHYLDRSAEYEDRCSTCPVTIVTGHACDELVGSMEDCVSPYDEYIRLGNPLPMIEILERVQAAEEEKKKNENVPFVDWTVIASYFLTSRSKDMTGVQSFDLKYNVNARTSEKAWELAAKEFDTTMVFDNKTYIRVKMLVEIE